MQDAVTCELPEQFKGKVETFAINPDISCGANQFIQLLSVIAEEAKEKLPVEKQSDLIAIGRQAYEELANVFVKNKKSLNVKNLIISGKDGNDIKLRLYEGSNEEKVILYVHGGGWIQGSLDTHDQLCQEISYRTKCSVIAVDYRLAPENVFPKGLEDVYSAYEWVLSKYKDRKIIVCGDSAGGNLSTVLTIKCIEENQKIPNGLLLLYPVLDLRIPEITIDRAANGYFLTRDRINAFIKLYLGHNFKNLAEQNSQVSPIFASDKVLQSLPPTLIIAGEFDPLTALSKEFVQKVSALGVNNVDLKIIKRTIHIFAQYPDLFEEAEEALELLRSKTDSM
jgi:acetyl esterase